MSEDSFQIESVIKHFQECLDDEDDIDLMTYVRAYEELSRYEPFRSPHGQVLKL